MIEIGTLLQDRYLIEKQIGAGGMGAVYLAVDRRFENYVAIKETFYTDDEFGDAFEREARILNGLNHPVLPHVSDFFTESGGHFLVMQFIEGADFSEILKPYETFPVKDVVRWTDSLLDALEYLHSQDPPVIHRDIKPQNLKLTPRGEIILLDFGLAKLNSKDNSDVKSLFGYSRKYSPLEQIQGTGTDARSDIFSLGATAYHLLTGKPPVDVLARASEIVVGKPDPLRLASELNKEVSTAVANVLNSAMELNAEKRFVSATAMRQALKNAVDLDLNESTEELPLEKSAAFTPVGEIVDHTEPENFPALSAFTDETIGLNSEVKDEKFDTVNILDSDDQIFLPEQEILRQPEKNADLSNKVSKGVYQSRIPLAALVALLICVGLVSAYFISNSNSSDDADHTKQIQPIPETETNLESPENVVLQLPEKSTSQMPDNIEQAKAKPVSAEKNTERNESVEESKTSAQLKEKPKPLPAQIEKSRQNPTRNSRGNETQNNGQTRPRIADSEPVPDIESVFTGRSSRAQNEGGRNQGNRRRQQREQMNDEEWEERRERRQQRRQPQNRRPFPF